MAKAKIMRPEIKKANLALQREKMNKTQAALSYLPDLNLGLSRHRINGEKSTWDVSFSFQVPLFFWQPASGEMAEAKSNYLSQQQELKYIRLTIALDVENAYRNAMNFKDQMIFFQKEVLKEAEEVYEMSMISYKEGKIGRIELIQSRKTLRELKQQCAETLYNFQLALADVQKAAGSQ